ncbi:MAG: hypothetical protein ACT4RN_01135 [Pseudonocardia sp.]
MTSTRYEQVRTSDGVFDAFCAAAWPPRSPTRARTLAYFEQHLTPR